MYKRFYQLISNPFRLAPEPDFCFSHSGYKRAREYLEYALDQGEGFVMVTGRPGTGKTMLVETFLKDIDIRRVVARRIAVSNFGADDLLRAVAFAYGIDAADLDTGTMRHRIQQYFVQQEQAGRRVLLIIDEAQSLRHAALEELRILADLQTQSRLMLQLFLVGQESLQDLMRTADMEQFQQRVIANYHLVPLNLVDVRDYIEHRLLQAGWSGDPEFTSAAVLSIFQLSKGVPRHINKICNRLLLLGFGQGQHRFDKEDVQEISREMHEELLAPMETSQAPFSDFECITDIPEIRDGLVSINDLAIRLDAMDSNASVLSEASRQAAKNKAAFIARQNDSHGSWYQQQPPLMTDPAAVMTERLYVSGARGTEHHYDSTEAEAAPNRFKWRETLVATAAMLAIVTIFIAALPSILANSEIKGMLSFVEDQIRERLDTLTVASFGLPADGLLPETGNDPVAPGVAVAADSEHAVPPDMQQDDMRVAAHEAPDSDVAEVDVHEPRVIDEQHIQTDEADKADAVTAVGGTGIPRAAEEPQLAAMTAVTVPVAAAVEQANTGQDETIEQLLAQGRQSLQEYRLVTPDDDNAYGYYREVLLLDPVNERASAGIQKIVDLYISLARTALDEHETERAKRYLARGLDIQPDNSEMLALKDSVDHKVETLPAAQGAVGPRALLAQKSLLPRTKTFLNKRQAEDRRHEMGGSVGRDG